MGYTKKLVTRNKISGQFDANDVQDGEYGAKELQNRAATRQEQLNESIITDWKKPGDDSPALGNAVSQLRKSIEKYGPDDDGKR